jgi:hypothetical protein
VRSLNDAAVTAARTAWTGGHVYRVGEVPANPATPYLVVSVDSGTARNYRKASVASSRYWRLSAQAVGDTYNEAAFAAEKAAAAFLDKRVTGSCTPCREETAADVQRDPDGGVLMYALLTYTFTTAG